MKLSNEKNLRVLNDLIETCRDGERGFGRAAQEVQDTELMRVFAHYAAQRAVFIMELRERVRAFGGDPAQHSSVSGTLHRGWMKVKSAVTSSEPHALLAECERGEDAAVKNFREALNEGELDEETRALIQRQAASVQEAHDRIKELRDSVAYAHR